MTLVKLLGINDDVTTCECCGRAGLEEATKIVVTQHSFDRLMKDLEIPWAGRNSRSSRSPSNKHGRLNLIGHQLYCLIQAIGFKDADLQSAGIDLKLLRSIVTGGQYTQEEIADQMERHPI